jgi:hypothetical protein
MLNAGAGLVQGKLIIARVKQYGDSILPDVLRGFEEFRLLQPVADNDRHAHLSFWPSRQLSRNPEANMMIKRNFTHFKLVAGLLGLACCAPMAAQQAAAQPAASPMSAAEWLKQ